MILVACVDDRMGMMFNRRRQSMDGNVRQDMLCCLPEGEKLHVTPYTARQFSQEQQKYLEVCEDPVHYPWKQEYFFAEDTEVSMVAQNAERIVLYRWGRAYPSDRIFSIDLSEYDCISQTLFMGNSHPEMQKELYERKGRKTT